MNWVFTMDQGKLLKKYVFDLQMWGGICYALATRWIFCKRANKQFRLGDEFYGSVSLQRAYQMTWEDKIKGNMGANDYANFFNFGESPSFKMLEGDAKRGQHGIARQRYDGLKAMTTAATGLGSGKAAMICLFGSDMNEKADAQNWGHAMAIANNTTDGMRFFDANQGEASWSHAAKGKDVAAELLQNLQKLYGGWGVRDALLYVVG